MHTDRACLARSWASLLSSAAPKRPTTLSKTTAAKPL